MFFSRNYANLMRLVVNFINVPRADFMRADPKFSKKTKNYVVFIGDFGICGRKSCLKNVGEIDSRTLSRVTMNYLIFFTFFFLSFFFSFFLSLSLSLSLFFLFCFTYLFMNNQHIHSSSFFSKTHFV